MLLIVLILCVILAFVFFVYIHNAVVSNLLTLLAILGLGTSLFFLVRNDHDHYGLDTVTTTSTQAIYSAAPSKQLQLVLYQPIGTADKHRVYIYKQTANAKKPGHTRTQDVTNHVKTTAGDSRIVTRKTYREYKNNTAKFWFGLMGNGHQFVHETNTIYVNKDWYVLSVAQSKQLQKTASSKSYQAKMKAEAKPYIQKKVMAAIQQNPALAAKQAELVKQATAEYQAQAMKTLIKQIQAQK